MTTISEVICPNPTCHRHIPADAKFCPFCGHDVILNNDDPSDDRRYWITRVIKQGGQGSVYEGVDQDGRIYAIKEMLDAFTDPKERDEALARFNAEAALLQKLRHPRIPRVYSHFTDEGRHYLTMDFVRGEDLEDIVERQGALPEAQVLEWADQICDVLAYLHENGLVYRDMKPSNVMIAASDGKIKLVDFGIAKLFTPTERGTQIGTPGYAPPEQYQGIATPKSDIFALGATLHHLLTGRDPTEKAPFSFRPARNININISRRTSDAIETALQMQPEGRFGSVAEFRAMLRPLPGTQTGPIPAARQTPSPASVAHPQVNPPPAAVPQRRRPSTPPGLPTQASARPAASPFPVPGTQTSPSGKAAARPRKQRKRRSPLRTCATTIVGVVLLVVAASMLMQVNPVDLVRPYLSDVPLIDEQPDVTLGPLQPLSVDLEVTVPVDADDTAIRAAFVEAYREQVMIENPNAQINPNAPPSTIGNPQEVSRAGDTVTYSGTVQGQVRLPQAP